MRGLVLLAAGAALTLSGCATAPTYFTLAPRPGPAQPGGPALVELRQMNLAGYLDRQEIVLADLGYRLRVASNEVWAEPPGQMIGRVLAEDLTQRLPGTTVFREAAGVSARPDVVVSVSVQRLDARPGGPVVLRAQVVLDGPHGRTQAETVTLMAPEAAESAAALAAADSTLLAQLSDRIATLLRATPAPPARRAHGRRLSSRAR